MIQITYNSGFTLKFANGISISVQFSRIEHDLKEVLRKPINSTQVAIVSLYDDKDKAIAFDNKTIFNLQSADDIGKWIAAAQSAKSPYDLIKHIVPDLEPEAWE